MKLPLKAVFFTLSSTIVRPLTNQLYPILCLPITRKTTHIFLSISYSLWPFLSGTKSSIPPHSNGRLKPLHLLILFKLSTMCTLHTNILCQYILNLTNVRLMIDVFNWLFYTNKHTQFNNMTWIITAKCKVLAYEYRYRLKSLLTI